MEEAKEQTDGEEIKKNETPFGTFLRKQREQLKQVLKIFQQKDKKAEEKQGS